MKLELEIEVVHDSVDIEVVFELDRGPPTVCESWQALADCTVFHEHCERGSHHLGILPSHGEAIQCRTDGCPLHRNAGTGSGKGTLPNKTMKSLVVGGLHHVAVKGIEIGYSNGKMRYYR